MDNFHIDLIWEGKENLEKALHLAFIRKYGLTTRAVGYSINDNVLIFYWVDSPKMTKFPFKMDYSQAAAWAHEWLMQSADYGEQPDHDGDNGKGWRIFTKSWGHVDGYESFIAIEPTWAEYGK